jgi:hypothetical protein
MTTSGRRAAVRRQAAVLGAAVIAGVVVGVQSAGVSGATVLDEATFRAAWADPSETAIDVGADIELTCGDGGIAVRNSSTALVVDGNGHRIAQTCANNGVLAQDGDGEVTLNSITVTGGAATGAGGGLVTAGPVSITDSAFVRNTAGDRGGGVAAVGLATVERTIFSDNHAGLTTADGFGGGIAVDGELRLTDSVLTRNTADGSGGRTGSSGAVIVRSTISDNVGPEGAGGTGSLGSIVVRDSTISGNSALNSGAGGIGAIGPITVSNSTVVDNEAGHLGGGGVFSDTSVTLIYATVVGNRVTAAAANLIAPTLTAFGSVVALPAGGTGNCIATTTANGFNYSDDSTCGFAEGGDPLLAPLEDNGGPTLTRAPLATSPLVGAIPTDSCQADGAAGITTDQRGVTRPQGLACDIGAVDVVGSPTPVRSQPQFTG